MARQSFGYQTPKGQISSTLPPKMGAATSLAYDHTRKRSLTTNSCHCAGRIDARVANLKLHRIDECTIAMAFSCPTTLDGLLFNATKGAASHVSNSIWYTTLSQRAYGNNVYKVRYVLWPSRPTNALKATGLISPLSPSPDACNDFDVASSGITFIARNLSICGVDPGRTDLYYIPLKHFSDQSPPKPQLFDVPGFEGSSSHPVFSPNGRSIAFLKRQNSHDEGDRRRLVVINDLDKPMPSSGDLPQRASREGWHLSPQSVSWSPDGSELYVVAEEDGQRKLFKVPYMLSSISGPPKPVATECSVFGIQGFRSSVSRLISLSPTMS